MEFCRQSHLTYNLCCYEKYMLIIIALILAIPTYGFSLILLFGYWWYKHKKLEKNLQKAIHHLLNNSSAISTCFDDIDYRHAATYLREKATRLRVQSGLYLEYEFDSDKGILVVKLDKEPNGKSAVMNASFIETWILNGTNWLNQFRSEYNQISIDEFPQLKEIVLGAAHLPEYSKDIKYLPKEIFKIQSLESMHLQYCNLKELPDEIKNLTKLKDLKLGGNALVSLPDSIVNLKSLEILTIWRNDLLRLPENIGKLTNLKGLSLWDTPLNYLPDSIVNLNRLEGLELFSMPNLKLTDSQKLWIKKLRENGCDVMIDEELIE